MSVGLNDEVDECAKEGRKRDDICTQKTIYHRDLRSKIEKHIKEKVGVIGKKKKEELITCLIGLNRSETITTSSI